VNAILSCKQSGREEMKKETIYEKIEDHVLISIVVVVEGEAIVDLVPLQEDIALVKTDVVVMKMIIITDTEMINTIIESQEGAQNIKWFYY
jgi:ribonuclease PH